MISHLLTAALRSCSPKYFARQTRNSVVLAGGGVGVWSQNPQDFLNQSVLLCMTYHRISASTNPLLFVFQGLIFAFLGDFELKAFREWEVGRGDVSWGLSGKNRETGVCLERTERPKRSPPSVGLLLYCSINLADHEVAGCCWQRKTDKAGNIYTRGSQTQFPDGNLALGHSQGQSQGSRVTTTHKGETRTHPKGQVFVHQWNTDCLG